MHGYLSADIICSENRTVCDCEQNCELQGTDNVQGQISVHFLRQMEAIVFIILQIFFATHAFLKIDEYLVNKHLLAPGMSADKVRG